MRWFRLFARRKKFAAAFSAVVCCLTILTPGADDACAMKVSYSNEDSSGSYDANDREETHEMYDANESYDIRGTYGIYDDASGVYRGEVYNTFRRIRYCPDIFVSEEDRIGTPLPKRTGWQMSRGEWIFREDDGDLFTGWKESDGERYYFDEEARSTEMAGSSTAATMRKTEICIVWF